MQTYRWARLQHATVLRIIDGPDDADIVVTVPVDIARAPGFDATVEFMRGKVKAAGHSGHVLDLLKSGAATTALAALAAQE